MPIIAQQLTAAQVDELTTTTAVGGVRGLTLVFTSGNRTWVLRYGTPRKAMGLGAYPEVSLKQARDLAGDAMALYRRGIDPQQHRQEQRAQATAKVQAAVKEKRNIKFAPDLFKYATAEFIELNDPTWSRKSVMQWTNTMATYAEPVIGAMPCAQITSAHIEKILRPIWETKHITATRVRERIEKILDFAAVKGYRQQTHINPAQWSGNMEFVMPKYEHAVVGHASMPHNEIATFLTYLGGRSNSMGEMQSAVSYWALAFTILTGARTGSIINAKWREIDWEERIWNAPPENMKGGRPFRVPLSPQAIGVLMRAQALLQQDGLSTEPDDYLFRQLSFTVRGRGKHGGRLSEAAMHALVKGYAGDTATVHGFRTSLRSWGAEQGHNRDVMEKILDHKMDDDDSKIKNLALVDTYQRSDLLEQRRPIMQTWADYVMPLVAQAEKADA